MSAKWLLSGTIAWSLAFGLPVAQAAEAPEAPADASTGLVMDLVNYAQAAEQIVPALPEEFTKVDPTILRVFLFNERRRPETEKLDLLVENRLQELILPLRRFKLIESRETKVKRVVSTPTALQVSTTIESLERMRELAKEIGADAVLMYSPFVTNRVAMVHLKLVRVSDGEIVFTHRYSYDFDTVRQGTAARLKAEEDAKKAVLEKELELERRNRDNGVYVYTGVKGFPARRDANPAGTPGRSADLSISVGMMALRNTFFWENLAVGLDAEYLQAGGVDRNLYYGVVNVTPLLFLRLDPLFVGKNSLGVVNLYGGPGMAFGLAADPLAQPATAKLGFLVRFTPTLFMDLGLTHFPRQNLKLTAASGLVDTMDYGGLTYHATFGVAFK